MAYESCKWFLNVKFNIKWTGWLGTINLLFFFERCIVVKFKRIIGVLILVIVMCSSSTLVFAQEQLNTGDATALKTLLSNTYSYDDSKLDSINIVRNGKNAKFSLFIIEKVKGVKEKDGIYYNIYFASSDFTRLSDNARELITANFKYALERSRISAEGKQHIVSELRNNNVAYNEVDTSLIADQVVDEITPDMFSAYSIFFPFQGVFGTFLGVVCIVIALGLVISTLLDISYISFPVVRERFNGDSDTAKRPLLISNEAFSTVLFIESNSGGTYKSPLLIYFKRRMVSYIVFALCLLYLLSGQIVNLVINFGNVISDAFGGWFS